MALVVENLPDNARDSEDLGSILGWGRSIGGGHDNPLQYFCLENPRDRGAWRAVGHKELDILKRLSTHTLNHVSLPFRY